MNHRAFVPLLASALLVGGCIGGSTGMKGEIRDDGITLAADHAGSAVRFELHNAGAKSCDLVVALTTLAANALPVADRQVVITNSDGTGIVQPITTYEETPPYVLKHIEPGATYSGEVALEGAPKDGSERVLFCNNLGDYQAGRYAILRFDR
jgi:hypothetical protein